MVLRDTRGTWLGDLLPGRERPGPGQSRGPWEPARGQTSLGRSHRRSRGTRRDDAGTRSTAPTPPGRPRFLGERLPRPHRCRRGTGETRQRPGWDSSLWADARDRSTGNSSPQVASQLQRDTQRSRDPLPSPALGQVTVLRFWPGHTEDSLPPDCSRGDLRPRAKDVLKAAGLHGPQCAGQGPGTGEAGPRDVPEAVGSASGPVSGLCHLSGLAGRAPRAPVVLGRAPRSAEAEACRVRGRVSRWHCHPIRERTEPRHCPFVSSVRRKSCRRQPGPRSPGRPPAVPGLCAPAGRRGATAEWPMGSPAPSPEARMGAGPGAGQEGHAGPAAGRAPRPPALPRALWQLGKPCGPSPQAPWAATALASPAGSGPPPPLHGARHSLPLGTGTSLRRPSNPASPSIAQTCSLLARVLGQGLDGRPHLGWARKRAAAWNTSWVTGSVTCCCRREKQSNVTRHRARVAGSTAAAHTPCVHHGDADGARPRSQPGWRRLLAHAGAWARRLCFGAWVLPET